MNYTLKVSAYPRWKKSWVETGVGQIMVQSIKNKDTESYGIVYTNGEYPKPFSSIGIKKLVEKLSPLNSPSNLAVLGR